MGENVGEVGSQLLSVSSLDAVTGYEVDGFPSLMGERGRRRRDFRHVAAHPVRGFEILLVSPRCRYNVLAYDLRNHGLSGAGSGETVGIGLLEYCDMIGSIRGPGRTRPA
jgi:pimeloyl-ACP methyl ester carboxylesterase